MSLEARFTAASSQLQLLLRGWTEPDSLRILRARELEAICESMLLRLARPANAAQDLNAIEHHLLVLEGFLRDHGSAVPLALTVPAGVSASIEGPVPAEVSVVAAPGPVAGAA